MPMYKFILAILVSTLALDCDCSRAIPAGPGQPEGSGVQPASTDQPEQRAADRLDVMEAVFRHLFKKNASAAQQGVEYFFLSLDHSADPPPELLARFQGHNPVVLPASLATASAEEGVKHKERGGLGLIFRVTQFVWLDENTAEVEGGYYEAGLSASGNTYHMKRIEGH